MPLLEAKNISRSYGEGHVIKQVSLTVEAGEVLAIMGPSGAGKSTLLKILAGLEPSNGGEVYFQGEALERPEDLLVPGHEELQYVAQDFKLLKNRTVYENVKEALLAFKDDFAAQQLDYLLNTFQLASMKDKRIELLSGGEKQRLAIARAMATEPEVLLLDEPFTQLDQVNRAIMIKALLEVNSTLNTSIVFVTHQPEEVYHLADRVGLLIDSQIQQIDTPKQVYLAPATLQIASLFGPVNPLSHALLKELGISFDQKKAYGIRPENVVIKNKAAKHAVKADVLSQTFHGNRFSIHLRLGDKSKMVTYQEELLEEKQSLFVSIKASSLLSW